MKIKFRTAFCPVHPKHIAGGGRAGTKERAAAPPASSGRPSAQHGLLHLRARPGSSALPLCSRGEPTAHAVTPLPAEARLPRLPRHPPHRGARFSADPPRSRLRPGLSPAAAAAPRPPLAGGAAAAPRLPQGLQRVQDVALHPRARRQLPHAGAAPRGARLKPARRNPRPPPRSAAAAPQPRPGGRPRAAPAPLSAATPAPRSRGESRGQPPAVSGGDPCKQPGSAFPPVLGSAGAPSPFPAGLVCWPCGCAPDLAPKPCPLQHVPAARRNKTSGATTATLLGSGHGSCQGSQLCYPYPKARLGRGSKKQVLRPVLLRYIWDLSN